MNFASLAFFIFLPTVFAIYWLLPRRKWQNVLLLGASYFFYGWWDYRFCFLMLASTLIDYFISLGIARSEHPGRRKRLLVFSLCSNLGLLGVFKYFNFFMENFVAATGSLGMNLNTGTLDIILPVGISFYTFQTLSYTIDVYYRKMSPTRDLIDYMTFVSFFPQLVAGPIERARNLLPQFQRERHFHAEFVQLGLLRILWGLFKKVVVADTLATFVNATYSQPASASGSELAVATVFFAFQIYCDFSGYSDIAIGTAHMFGIKLMRNFAYPYFSQNLREFWQRWHISLSTWFRDYVYIPLGGNRVSALRQKWNLLVTFVISGFWHGAAWPYIVWGALHGAVVSVWRPSKQTPRMRLRQAGGDGLIPHPMVAVRILSTFLFVCFCWIFFRADTLADCGLIIGKIGSEALTVPFYQGLAEVFRVPEIARAGWVLLFLIGLEWVQRRREHPLELTRLPEPLRWSTISLVAWFVIEYGGKVEDNPFIYFQF
jgi:alginate O-acetyltransferase complex protein AlgI